MPIKIPKDIKKEIEKIIPPELAGVDCAVSMGDIESSPETRLSDQMDALELVLELLIKELAAATLEEPENIKLVGARLAFCVKAQADNQAGYYAIAFRDGYRKGYEKVLRGGWDAYQRS